MVVNPGGEPPTVDRTCIFCLKTLNPKKFLQHVQAHINGSIYTCNLCDKVFTAKINLRRHMTRHTVEKRFSCIFCAAIFHDSGTRNRHLRSCHLKEKPFICKICGKEYASRHVHMKMHKEESVRYSCTTCEKTYSEKSKLIAHNIIHTGEMPYSWKICKRKFRNNKILQNHLTSSHSGSDLQHPCKICGNSFKTERYLQSHSKRHFPGNFSCTLCSKLYHTKEGLRKHMKSHQKPISNVEHFGTTLYSNPLCEDTNAA